jgi:hypothetical protein
MKILLNECVASRQPPAACRCKITETEDMGTVKQLEENVDIARAFAPMPTAEMAKLEEVTNAIVPDALWFRRDAAGFGKTTEDDQNMD